MAIDHRGVKRASGKDYLIWQCVFSYRLTETIGMQQLPNSVSSPENITMYEVITWRAGGGLPGGAACAMKWPNWLHTYVRFLHDVLPSVNAMHNMRSKGQRCRLVGKRNRVRRRHWRKWRTNETRVSPPLHPSSLRHDEIERCSYNSLEEIRHSSSYPPSGQHLIDYWEPQTGNWRTSLCSWSSIWVSGVEEMLLYALKVGMKRHSWVRENRANNVIVTRSLSVRGK